MSYYTWANEKIRNFQWFDISLIKLASAAFALMLAKIWPSILSLDWTAYLVVAIIASLPVLVRMFR
jgi:hypothetical protein